MPTVMYLSPGGEKDLDSSSGKSRAFTAAHKTSHSDMESRFSSEDNEPLSTLLSGSKASKTTNINDESSQSSSDFQGELSQPIPDPSEPESDSMRPSTLPKKRKVGRPKGKAKPPVHDFLVPTSIMQKNVRRDMVDEDCERRGIFYRKWQPLHPDQTSHPSVRDFDDCTVILPEQQIPQWCILCPKNTYLKNEVLATKHYLSCHHKTLIVVEMFKMWVCKCSEMHSHGTDNSARNKHYHCHKCFHLFKMSDLLATHYTSQHADIEPGDIVHLMRPDNPHRHRF